MTEAAEKKDGNVLALPKLNPTRDSTRVSDNLKAFAIACQADGLRHETVIVDPRSKFRQHMTPQYNKGSKFRQHIVTDDHRMVLSVPAG